MEDKTKFGFIFKVLFIHKIPLSFRKILINSNPEMSSVDDSSHQYSVETILDEYENNISNYTEKDEKEFINFLVKNEIDYIEF